MNEQLAAKIRNAPNLPTLPAIAIEVLDLAHKPDADIAQIARIISKDPALSGKILRTVNSSFYGRSNNVATISHALVILGLQSVKTLVLGFSLVSNLSKNKVRGFKHIAYWKRAIFTATAARTLAARVKVPEQEEGFLAALLADIGMLLLDSVLGDAYGDVHDRVTSHVDLAAAEQAALGATHAEVGGMLAEIWRLPAMLSGPIKYHTNPSHATEPVVRKLAELVDVAGRCADVFVDDQPGPAVADARRLCLERYQLAEVECDALLADIGRRTKEVSGLFELNIWSVAEYEAILKKANEALVDITLKTQQHASTLAHHATSLQQQNQQLQHKASTDALTGLANRAKFDAHLAEQLAAAVKAQRPLAVLMIDLDKFKSINDAHGHPAGDAVLCAVARVLAAAVKKPHGLAARYGGEELAVVVPGMTLASTAALAETIRRSIEARPVPTGKAQIPVTASIGLAVYEPGSPLVTPPLLVKAADMAVYSAKSAGRNCVKIFSLKHSAPAKSPPAAA